MKRSIILLMALIVLCAMPILASTPEQDMVLIVDEGDGEFSGLEQVSDEEMMGIVGDKIVAAYDPNITGPLGNLHDYIHWGRESLNLFIQICRIVGNAGDIGGWITDIIYGINNGLSVQEIIWMHLMG